MFQIDLALDLMECGIKNEREAPYGKLTNPKWMRQTIHYAPCNCDTYFSVRKVK